MSVITKKLIEVCEDIVMGQSPESSSYNTFGIGLPFYQGKAEFGKQHPVPVKWCSSPKKIAKTGDILMSVRAPVGATNIANEECCIGRGLAAIRVNPEQMDRDFLLLQLKHLEKALIKKGKGSTFEAIGSDILYGLEVFAPDLEIQQTIGKKLTYQLSEIEKAREATEIIRRDIEFLKKRIRQSAFEELLERYERSSLFKEVCNISAGGTPSRGNSAFFSGNIPWVKTLDLNFGLVTDTQEKITDTAFKSIRGALLPKGTVLVAMYGGAGTIGKSGILGIEACTNQAIAAMVPNQEFLTSDFLHEWICFIRPEWMQYSSGNRKDPNINKAVVENMTMPVPSLQEQNLITNSIKDAYFQAILLEQAVNNQHLEITSMASKILAEAFNEIENG